NAIKGLDGFGPNSGHGLGKALLPADWRYEQCLLGAPDKTFRRALQSLSRYRCFVYGILRFQDVEAHDIALGVVQHDSYGIEVDDRAKLFRQFPEERGQACVRANRFRDRKQTLVAKIYRAILVRGTLNAQGNSLHRDLLTGAPLCKRGARR